MNRLPTFVKTAVAAAIGLALMILGGVFAVSLLLAVLLVVGFGALGALLSGRRPAAFEIWRRWREMRDGSRFGRFGARFGASSGLDASRRAGPAPDVVDVQARDLPREPR